MSRTARPDVSRRLPGVAAAAALAALTACGPTAQPQAQEATVAATPAPSSGAADFCDQAARIDARVDAALSGLDRGEATIADAFRLLAAELRGIDAPDPIATAWAEMSAGLDRAADALADLDITDTDSLEALDRAETGLTAAGTEVENYLRDECGL